MIIGVPKEIKSDEYRVGMVPGGAEKLVERGHCILLERGAGEGSGISDEDYVSVGVEVVPTAAEIFERADMVVKVKEPQPAEFPLMRRRQIIATYFHFAASRELTEAMLATGAVTIAYETVEDHKGALPMLIPMSEVAGRMSIQEGAKSLEKPMHGRGILLAGVPGVTPASVVVLGGARSATMPRRSPPACAPMSPSLTSTSTGCVTWTT